MKRQDSIVSFKGETFSPRMDFDAFPLTCRSMFETSVEQNCILNLFSFLSKHDISG